MELNASEYDLLSLINKEVILPAIPLPMSMAHSLLGEKHSLSLLSCASQTLLEKELATGWQAGTSVDGVTGSAVMHYVYDSITEKGQAILMTKP